jgi:hypothetical protein
MYWIAVDKDGVECMFKAKPIRNLELNCWTCSPESSWLTEREGLCLTFLDKQLTWSDEPVEIEDEN